MVKRKRASKGAKTPALSPLEVLSRESLKLQRSLEVYEAALSRYLDSDPLITPPPFTSLVCGVAWRIPHEIHDARDAQDAVDAGVPVPAFSSSGDVWTPPVTAEKLRELAAMAKEGDLPFSEQASLNMEAHRRHREKVERATNSLCPRCGNRRVTWPGRNESPACYKHISEPDAVQVAAAFREVVAVTACRGCGAKRGTECNDRPEKQRRIDGYYSGKRSFRKHTIHLVRIEDYEEQPDAD